MRKIATALATCAVALAAPASSQAIVNGTPDGSAHPNVGALTVNSNGTQVLACSGTLVSPTVVVTAAHCTAQLQQLGYSTADVTFSSDIGTGSDMTCDLTDCVVVPDPKSLHTGTLYTNPAFNGKTLGSDSGDVGVVQFAKPIKGITPAALPTAGQLDGMQADGSLASQTFTTVGYGWHDVVSWGGGTGLFDGLRRNAPSVATSLVTSDLKLDSSASQGNGGACSHDSGGPALIGNTVFGVVSGLQGPCSSEYYDYRLDTQSARSFLANFVTLP